MRINVTQRDIDYGKRGNAYSCPVSRAIKRNSKVRAVTVGITTARIYPLHEVQSKVFFLPRFVTQFITEFDAERDVKPFTFKIRDLESC